MKKLLILITTICMIGCEVAYECGEDQSCIFRLGEEVGTDGDFEVISDTDSDTDMDTDCRVSEACTVVYNPACVHENDKSWLREWKGCLCNDGIVLRYYEDKMCSDGCIEYSKGAFECAEDVQEGRDQ